MLQSKSRAWVSIDRKAILHNLEEIKKILHPNNEIMAVVKANAYGHGDKVVAKLLENHGVKSFAVSSVDEAINLREAGIVSEILILGYTPQNHLHFLVEYDLIQNFLSLEYAQICDEVAKELNTKIKGHIKVDTGMARLGVRCVEDDYQIAEVISIYKLEHLDVQGIFSHFSVADELDEENKAYTDHQKTLFERVLKDLSNEKIEIGRTHLQNSYGVLNYQLPYDYVRPGLLLVGVTSDDAILTNTQPDFIPALSLRAQVSRVQVIHAGSDVSYGRHYHADALKTIATCSIGYADGIPRSASNLGMQVLVQGKRCEIVGNICMDQCMIDVSECSDVHEGDIVTFIGKDGDEQIKVDEWSRKIHTINNDFLCRISARVPRFYTPLK